MQKFELIRADGRQQLKVGHRATSLLRYPLFNKGIGFTPEERERFRLHGLLPAQYNSIDVQAERVYRSIMFNEDPVGRHVDLAALQDRNEHLYYRVLMDHLAELMPIVYTPTVGLATQRFSEVFERGRGLWITPAHRGRVREVLETALRGRDIRLTVVTDNESILGIGDQGAGGMAISIGKLSLYTAGAGIDPATTLPVSLDVGTNNRDLLQNDLYLGWPRERLGGAEYDDLVDEFVSAFTSLYPDALIQWEDFRKDNALGILERYRHKTLSFNDDIQGTGAVALAGLFSALRVKGQPIEAQRIVILGAGAAGLGIARQTKAALREAGVAEKQLHEHIAVLDSRGLLVDDTAFSEDYKAELAWPAAAAAAAGITEDRSLDAVVEAWAPGVLIGTSGQPGSFHEALVQRMAEREPTPVIMPMSNPTANSEATPAELTAWTDGRALIATGSPFMPVNHAGRSIEIGQGNNVFVFPAIGLGALLAGAREVSDGMITAASKALAESVTEDELDRGLLYPDVTRLRDISARCAAAVWQAAAAEALARHTPPADPTAAARDAMWTPDYPEFV